MFNYNAILGYSWEQFDILKTELKEYVSLCERKGQESESEAKSDLWSDL